MYNAGQKKHNFELGIFCNPAKGVGSSLNIVLIQGAQKNSFRVAFLLTNIVLYWQEILRHLDFSTIQLAVSYNRVQGPAVSDCH